MTSTERVKAICKERKIPISKLERECGFSNGYIGQLKKGLPEDRCLIVAQYLGVTTEYLCRGEDDEKTDVDRELESLLRNLTDDEKKFIIESAKNIVALRK